jgi:hypothetical protein
MTYHASLHYVPLRQSAAIYANLRIFKQRHVSQRHAITFSFMDPVSQCTVAHYGCAASRRPTYHRITLQLVVSQYLIHGAVSCYDRVDGTKCINVVGLVLASSELAPGYRINGAQFKARLLRAYLLMSSKENIFESSNLN